MSSNVFQPVVLFSKGNASSVTGTTVETTLGSFTCKAGMVGKNDYFEVYCDWSHTNSANSKTLSFKIGSTNFIATVDGASVISYFRHVQVSMRGATNSQVSFRAAATIDNGTNAVAPATGAEDMSVDKTIAFTGTLANSGETITLESGFVILWKEQNP